MALFEESKREFPFNLERPDKTIIKIASGLFDMALEASGTAVSIDTIEKTTFRDMVAKPGEISQGYDGWELGVKKN